MAATPTFFNARNYKQIGVNTAGPDNVIVKYDGEILYGGKTGDASCISKSMDFGLTWNDYTLLDNNVTTADDIWMSATGDPWYLASHDATTTAIFRISMFSVTRVLCVYPADATSFILRGIASDANVIYAADSTAPRTTIFVSTDGGVSRWNKRLAPAGIQDLAVENSTTIYIGAFGTANIYKSINSGFTWGLPVSTKLAAGSIYSMLSLSANNLIVGGTAGGVNYSTDGGVTWTVTFGLPAGSTNVLVAASGLAAGDFIFAADSATVAVYRCALGPANPFGEFKTMNMTAATTTEVNVGLVYTQGVLYAIDSTAVNSYVNRTLMPTFPGTHINPFWGTRYAQALPLNRGVLPPAIRASTGAPGDIMLYGINPTVPGIINLIYYYQDTLALNAPVLTGPADKATIQLTSATNGTVQPVNFTWNRVSLATNYNLFIALDALFTQPVGAPIPVPSAAPIVSAIVGGGLFNPGLTYYWMVAASVPLASKASEIRSFTVQQVAASVPSIGSPASGATDVATKPAFSWTPVAGTTMYEFQMDTGTLFVAPMIDEQSATTAIRLTTMTLEAGKTYFWRVRSLQPTQGDWSSIGSFTVAVPATPPPTPTITIPPTPTFTITVPPPVTITIPTQPATKEISPAYIWAIIIIGAVLVIAVIALIVRTRRSV